jgi:hypothetical protein
MSVDAILFSSVVGVATPAWLASVVLLLCLAAAAGLPLARRNAAPGATLILAPVFGLTGLVIVAALPIPFARATVGGLLVVATLANLVLPRRALSLHWLVSDRSVDVHCAR